MERITLPDDFDTRWPGGRRGATEAFMNLVRTADVGMARISRLLRPFDLTPPSGLVISMLADSGPLSPSEIGERLIVTRATVTGLLDSLERRGLVRRVAHPTDRRSLLVEVTAEGRRTANRLRKVIHAAEARWLGGLSESERRQLVRILHKLQDRLSNPDG